MDYFEAYWEEIARQFLPNGAIKRFANNPAVIGALAEATVRKFVRSYVAPIHISTGSVISPEFFKQPNKARQIDTILWSPFPLAAIFEADDFALVPQMSCLGILEVKRSAYNGVGKALEGVFTEASQLVRPLELSGESYDDYKRALGVICLSEGNEDAKLKKMLADKSLVVLTRSDGDQIVPDGEGIETLIQYLQTVRKRYHALVHELTGVRSSPAVGGTSCPSSPKTDGLGLLSTHSGYYTN